jgi:hypothetical protein
MLHVHSCSPVGSTASCHVRPYKQSGAILNDICNWHSAVAAFNVMHASFYPRLFSRRTEKPRRFEFCHRLTTDSASAFGCTSAPLRQTNVMRHRQCGSASSCTKFVVPSWSSEGPAGQIVTLKSYLFKSHRHFPRFRSSRIHAVKHVVNIISQLDGKPDTKMSSWSRMS